MHNVSILICPIAYHCRSVVNKPVVEVDLI